MIAPRWFVTAILAAAIVSPLARDRGWDSFPLSSFPMFSRGDLGSEVSLGHALLVARDGARRPAAPSLVGTPEPMVAKNVIELAIAEGRASELCAKIARVAPADAASVEIVSSTYDTRRYFQDRTPLRREVHATCNVSR